MRGAVFFLLPDGDGLADVAEFVVVHLVDRNDGLPKALGLPVLGRSLTQVDDAVAADAGHQADGEARLPVRVGAVESIQHGFLAGQHPGEQLRLSLPDLADIAAVPGDAAHKAVASHDDINGPMTARRRHRLNFFGHCALPFRCQTPPRVSAPLTRIRAHCERRP